MIAYAQLGSLRDSVSRSTGGTVLAGPARLWCFRHELHVKDCVKRDRLCCSLAVRLYHVATCGTRCCNSDFYVALRYELHLKDILKETEEDDVALAHLEDALQTIQALCKEQNEARRRCTVAQHVAT